MFSVTRLVSLAAVAATTLIVQIPATAASAAPPPGGGFSGVAGDFNGDGRDDIVTFTRGAALCLLGGLAGAGATTLIHGPTVEKPVLDDGRAHVRIVDAASGTVFDGVLDWDEPYAYEGHGVQTLTLSAAE